MASARQRLRAALLAGEREALPEAQRAGPGGRQVVGVAATGSQPLALPAQRPRLRGPSLLTQPTEYRLVKAGAASAASAANTDASALTAQAVVVALDIGHSLNLAALPQPVKIWRQEQYDELTDVVEPLVGAGATYGREQEELARQRRIQRSRERNPGRRVEPTLHLSAGLDSGAKASPVATAATATAAAGQTQPGSSQVPSYQHFEGTKRETENMRYYYLLPDDNDETVMHVFPAHKYYQLTKARRTDLLNVDEALTMLERNAQPKMVIKALQRKKREALEENEAAEKMLAKSMREGAAGHYNEGGRRGGGEDGDEGDGDYGGDDDGDGDRPVGAGVGGNRSKNSKKRYMRDTVNAPTEAEDDEDVDNVREDFQAHSSDEEMPAYREILGPAASDNEEDEIEEDANEEGDEDEDNALSTLKLLEDQSKAEEEEKAAQEMVDGKPAAPETPTTRPGAATAAEASGKANAGKPDEVPPPVKRARLQGEKPRLPPKREKDLTDAIFKVLRRGLVTSVELEKSLKRAGFLKGEHKAEDVEFTQWKLGEVARQVKREGILYIELKAEYKS